MTAYSIFQEPWWLDAVAPGAWRSLEVIRSGLIVARMPISLRRKFGFRIIRNPPLTPRLGPWLRKTDVRLPKWLALEKELLNALIDQIPLWDYFEASFHPEITNWLPFYWHGFQQTTRYTYILEDTADLDRVWHGLQDATRRNVRKARRELSIRTDLPVDRLIDLATLTFRRQGQRLPFAPELLKRIDAACATRAARQMFFAEDAKGRVHAALYVVADRLSAYYLLGGADPQLRDSGAQNLLLWEAIQYASNQKLMFDFEGSMIEPVERVFRGFGARQVPYLHVYGARPLARFALGMTPDAMIRRMTRK